MRRVGIASCASEPLRPRLCPPVWPGLRALVAALRAPELPANVDHGIPVREAHRVDLFERDADAMMAARPLAPRLHGRDAVLLHVRDGHGHDAGDTPMRHVRECSRFVRFGQWWNEAGASALSWPVLPDGGTDQQQLGTSAAALRRLSQ